MTQPIENVLLQVSTVVGKVAGIMGAPQYPPETITYDPFAITFLMGGEAGGGAVGTKRDLLNVSVDLFVPRRVLDQDMAVLIPLIDPIVAALLGEIAVGGGKFAGAIDTFEKIAISYLPRVDYAGVEMTGYRFQMLNVKVLVNL